MASHSSKVKINLKEGIFEIEGSEEFILKIIDEHKDLVSIKQQVASVPSSSKEFPDSPLKEQKPVKKERTARTRASRQASKTVEAVDLDLSAGEDFPSLKEFYTEKKPRSQSEKNALFAYWLEENHKIEIVTPGHLVTCYKGVDTKIPASIGQSILDTKIPGYFTADSGSTGGILSNLGRNLVKLELPRKQS